MLGTLGELRVTLSNDEAVRLPPLLPHMFADSRHLGGAEEVCRLHEARELCRTSMPATLRHAPPRNRGLFLAACHRENTTKADLGNPWVALG
jgi:hypothetical protein